MPTSHQHSGHAVAVSPTVPRPLQLNEEIQDIAARLSFSVPDLAKDEKQFLWDQARRSGHTLRSLERMADLAARSTKAADREALPECLRARTLRRERLIAGSSLVAAEDEEVLIEQEENIAQRERMKRDDRTTRERLIGALRSRLNVTRRLLDALCTGAR
jgi:hypothetical protein